MKNLLLKLYVFIFLMTGDYILFAQPLDDGTGDAEGDDVPVNGKLIFLVIGAVAFAYYYFTKGRKTQKAA